MTFSFLWCYLSSSLRTNLKVLTASNWYFIGEQCQCLNSVNSNAEFTFQWSNIKIYFRDLNAAPCELSKNNSDSSSCHSMHKLSHQRAGVYSEVFEILITCIHLLRPACALKFGLLTIGLFIMQGYRMQLATHFQASVHPTLPSRISNWHTSLLPGYFPGVSFISTIWLTAQIKNCCRRVWNTCKLR